MRGYVAWLLLGAVLGACVVLRSQHSSGHLDELVEIDGIELDKNAARALSGGGSSGEEGSGHDRTSYPTDPTDKLLKQHAADVLDGVALDTNAEKTLHPHRSKGYEGDRPGGKVARGRRTEKTDPGQALLVKGESELDSQRYYSALSNLRGAEAKFKQEGRSDWHWAQTLVQDVLRSHPELSHGSSSAHAHAASPAQGDSANSMPMGQGRRVRRAAKELAAGKEFRSLYGLARDEHAAHRAAVTPPAAKAPTSSLAEIKVARASQGAGVQGKDAVRDEVRREVRREVRNAERRLVARNKLVLLHEEAAIQRKAQEMLQARQQGYVEQAVQQQEPAVRQEVLRPQYAPLVQQQQLAPFVQQQQLAPLAPFPGQDATPSFAAGTSPAQAVMMGQQQAQAALGRLRMHHQAVLQAMANVPAPPLASVNVEEEAPEESLTAVSSNSGDAVVPTVNLNLAPGQKLAPGQYEMDGQLVPDAQGQYNFVGNLVPRLKVTNNADPLYMRMSSDPAR